ncbi:hypothetical protein BC831DRAFT_221843 [Entophlyctis helioformis]|nr:hypothetical protein BC831DRAFT_221843 [Entophlyctis helioformis]
MQSSGSGNGSSIAMADPRHKYARLVRKDDFERQHPNRTLAFESRSLAARRDPSVKVDDAADPAPKQVPAARPAGPFTGTTAAYLRSLLAASVATATDSATQPQTTDQSAEQVPLAAANSSKMPDSATYLEDLAKSAPGMDGALVDFIALYGEIKQRRLQEMHTAKERETSRWAAFMRDAQQQRAASSGQAPTASFAPATDAASVTDSIARLSVNHLDSQRLVHAEPAHTPSIDHDGLDSGYSGVSPYSESILSFGGLDSSASHSPRDSSLLDIDALLRAKRQNAATRSLPPRIRSPRPLQQVPVPTVCPIWPSEMARVQPYPDLIDSNSIGPEFYHIDDSSVAGGTAGSGDKTSLEDGASTPMEPRVVFKADFNSPKTEPFYKPVSPEDDTLVFESRFESGNLHKATQTARYSYDLLLRKDLNTKGHTQWFYFSIKNARAGIDYQFSITNLMKTNCLYTQGMQPLVYSEALAASQSLGWIRAGRHISYTRNPVSLSDKTKRPSHSLRFTLSFPVHNDTIYVAHCYPYTYSDLQRYLSSLKQDPARSLLFRHRVLCKSLCGNNVDLLSVTKRVNHPDELVGRKAIILSARVHPGETNSSWMMQGFIEFILGNSPQAAYLRQHYVIKIIPMLNPDGVIIGNHRCNLMGYDLNRQWRMTDAGKEFAPEIWHARNMVLESAQARQLVLYCDMHGHNRKHGAFVYGCNNDSSETLRYAERVFPYMLSQRLPSSVIFKRSQFQLQKSKEGTSRISLHRLLGVVNSFTIEASFCGTDAEPDGARHFHINDLMGIGDALGQTLFDYFGPDTVQAWASDADATKHAAPSRVDAQPRTRQDVSSSLPFSNQHTMAVYEDICRHMRKGDVDLMPDASESSDTTSDDEKLRMNGDEMDQKKKRKVKQKKKPVKPPPLASNVGGQSNIYAGLRGYGGVPKPRMVSTSSSSTSTSAFGSRTSSQMHSRQSSQLFDRASRTHHRPSHRQASPSACGPA